MNDAQIEDATMVEFDKNYRNHRMVGLFVRGSHRCGYVAIPKDSPFYGVKYSEERPEFALIWDALKGRTRRAEQINYIVLFCASLSDRTKYSPDLLFAVHGGITFSGEETEYPITTSEPIFWYGFDCAHAGDKTLYTEGVMRDMEYVEQECMGLIDQLIEFAKILNAPRCLPPHKE